MSKSLIPLSLVPPGINDERQRALVQTFGEMLAELDLTKLSLVAPMTVDARALPYLVRAFSAQEFVDPNFPEHVQRRILSEIWRLKSLQGYTAGVRLGLRLLGMQMRITQWHDMQPMGVPNTHEITFSGGRGTV
ncbi:Phage tail protein (Tail_P2_I) [Pelagimonas phthalicica]|uniref:Phage tail protein (Tail_P2_I) n=1 Tax=Pelagimonas phthalicica TaxID=1037362 RepID=A0A238JEV2_9RHOB|nr:phage tail protein I [Pelagimonas phthalicica]TDS92109.1 phage tail P2-like protein [Pelagimonas phthalicica]SMX29159.1 Phage tail protein (Tail_P2_I) [Pelagimonas phthalicica]